MRFITYSGNPTLWRSIRRVLHETPSQRLLLDLQTQYRGHADVLYIFLALDARPKACQLYRGSPCIRIGFQGSPPPPRQLPVSLLYGLRFCQQCTTVRCHDDCYSRHVQFALPFIQMNDFRILEILRNGLLLPYNRK